MFAYLWTGDPVTEPGGLHTAGDSVYLDVFDADGVDRSARLRELIPGDRVIVASATGVLEVVISETQIPGPVAPDTTAILTGTAVVAAGEWSPSVGDPLTVTLAQKPSPTGGKAMPTEVFKIANGEVGFSTTQPVNAGDVTLSTIAEYDAFNCRVVSAVITSSPNFETETIPGTFCDPAAETNTPQATTFTLELEVLQDPQDDQTTGLAKFLWDNDSGETGNPVWFYVGLANGAAPKAIGQCMIYPMDFGGTARSVLTASLSFPCEGRPSPEWGTTPDV